MGATHLVSFKLSLQGITAKGCLECWYLDGEPRCSGDCKIYRAMKEISVYGNCPHCGSSWDDGDIEENFLRQKSNGNEFWASKSDEEIHQYVQEFYSHPRRFSRLQSYTVQGQDKVSGHVCPDCQKEIAGKIVFKLPDENEQ